MRGEGPGEAAVRLGRRERSSVSEAEPGEGDGKALH